MSNATKAITKFRQRIEKVDVQLEELRAKISEKEKEKEKVIEQSIDTDSALDTTAENDGLKRLWDNENDLHTLQDLLSQRLNAAYEDRRSELRSNARKQLDKALVEMSAADKQVRELEKKAFAISWTMSQGYVGEPVAEVEGCTPANRGVLRENINEADRALEKIERMSHEELTA